MLKKIPTLAVWFILAVAAITVPLACGSTGGDSNDGNSEKAPVDMTSAG
jgi:hypothetical protein